MMYKILVEYSLRLMCIQRWYCYSVIGWDKGGKHFEAHYYMEDVNQKVLLL